MREKLKDRFNLLVLVLVVIFAAILYQLVCLQIVKGSYYDERSQRGLLKESTIVASRGNIIDRNGITIASNQLGFVIQIVKTKTSNDQMNDMLLELTRVLEKNHDSYKNSLSKYLTINPIQFGPQVNQSADRLLAWKKNIVLSSKDMNGLDTPEAVFNYFRKVRFKISDKYSIEDAYRIMTIRYEISQNISFSALNPVTIAQDASKESVAEIEERGLSFPGVFTDWEPMRKYIDGQYLPHVLGYVDGINNDEYEKLKSSGYGMNDIIGKSGIELAMEKYLKGTDGQKKIEMDTSGHQAVEVAQTPAIPGDDIIMTLDTQLQKIAAESLQRNIELIRNRQGAANIRGNYGDAFAGAVVAMDVNNGEILAMASYPSYDPTIFLEDANNKEAQAAIAALFADNKGTPTFNRAISGKYPPGSTFKPVIAIAGLEENVITKDTIIEDSGILEVDGHKFYCLEYKNGLGVHGALKLDRALATSCNIYFHKLGIQLGIDTIDKWANLFGLGELTGIDIPNEVRGTVASREFKKKAFASQGVQNYSWWPADTAQAGIGQSFNAFTPIELTNYIATIANGGRKYKPHLVKRVVNSSGNVEVETSPEYVSVPIKQSTIDAVKEGMIAVTNSEDGTAIGIFQNLPFKVAGKTGTAETGNSNVSDNAVFVCYAPAENPQIAIAVVIERGVFGYLAAPVARDLIYEYFGFNQSTVKTDTAGSNAVTFVP